MKAPIQRWLALTILSGMEPRPSRLRRLLHMPIDAGQKVAVLGLGYIGLPTAALIARSGCQVTGGDVSPKVVETVNGGRVHHEAVDLDGLVQGLVARGAHTAMTAVPPSAIFVLAVPPPPDDDHPP